MFPTLRGKKGRHEYLRTLLGDFAHENKDLFLIVCDPKTDDMFVAYRDKMILGKIKTQDGKSLSVIKDMLNESTMHNGVERFIGALVDTLKVSLTKGNDFYHFVAESIYKIAETIKNKVEQKSTK